MSSTEVRAGDAARTDAAPVAPRWVRKLALVSIATSATAFAVSAWAMATGAWPWPVTDHGLFLATQLLPAAMPALVAMDATGPRARRRRSPWVLALCCLGSIALTVGCLASHAWVSTHPLVTIHNRGKRAVEVDHFDDRATIASGESKTFTYAIGDPLVAKAADDASTTSSTVTLDRGPRPGDRWHKAWISADDAGEVDFGWGDRRR